MNKSLLYITTLSLEMATLRAYYVPEVSSHKLSSSEPVDPSPGSLQSWAVVRQHPPQDVTPELLTTSIEL